MANFKYTVRGEVAYLVIPDYEDTRPLAYATETALLGVLQERGMEIDPDERLYLLSEIASAIVRDHNEEIVDLGEIKVK